MPSLRRPGPNHLYPASRIDSRAATPTAVLLSVGTPGRTWVGLLTVVSPILMTCLLVAKPGQSSIEKRPVRGRHLGLCSFLPKKGTVTT